MTDTFRALCAELANYLQGRKDLECGWGEEDPEQDLLDRARAALAQPEPEGATDEVNALQDACDAYDYAYRESAGMAHTGFGPARGTVHHQAGLRAVLQRWGRPAIEPVPVSERPILKSSNFNDANGHCWCGTSASVDETGDLSVEMPPSWELREPCAQDDCVLPHHALPVPTTH